MNHVQQQPGALEPPRALEDLLQEVSRRGLQVYFWDGHLHFLPARLAARHADLVARLLQLNRKRNRLDARINNG